MAEETVDVLGGTVFSRSWGQPRASATPVVLLHGLAVSHRYFIPLGRALLARGAYVVAPDMPGYGRSSALRGTPRTEELARRMLAWMDACRMDRATLAGNSYGCQVAATMAALRPACADRLVLIGTVDDRVHRASHLLWRGLRDARRERLWDLALKPMDVVRMGPANAVRTLQECARYAIIAPLQQADVATTLVRGAYDPISPQAWNDALAAAVQDAKVVTVADAGHDVHARRPDVVAEIILHTP